MSPAQAPQRYPKRKRGEVSYKYVDESEELGEDVEHAIPIQDDPDNEVDWKTSMKKVMSEIRFHEPAVMSDIGIL